MKKFFSAFLLMAAMAFSVGTLVSCNDVMDEIEDVKAQTTQNTAAIDALNAEIAALKNELADAQAAADEAKEAAEEAKEAADEAQGTAEEALEAAEAAALEAAANANAIESLIDELETLKTAYYVEVAKLETALAGKVDQTEYDAFVAELNTKLAAALERLTTVEGNVSKLLDAEISIKARLDVLEAFKDAATLRIDSLKTDLTAAEAEIDKLWEAVNTNKSDIVTLKADLDIAEALLEDHSKKISDLYDKYSAVAAQVATLLARIQSLVYVPEYSDGKADILYGTINTTAGSSASAISDLMIVSHASTLKYKVNADNAAEVASAIAAAKNDLSYEVKTVKTRAQEELVPALEIVNVTAENGYILVDVYAKNFAKEFFLGKKNMYSAALKLSDGNNNTTTEFTNLTAVKVNELTPVVEPKEELHEIPYDKVDTTVVILEGNKVVFYNENGVALTDAQVAKYDFAIERSLEAKQGEKTVSYSTNAEGEVYTETNDEGERRIYDVTFNTEINDFVVRMGDKFTRDDKGRKFPFQAVYTINGFEVAGNSVVELTSKLVTYDIPAIEVPWSVAVAQELSENQELYVKNLVRSTEFAVPANFEGYTLHSIVQTGTTVRREVTVNGAAASKTDIQAKIGEKEITLTLVGDYAFPEYDAANDWNEYTITWVKDHESVRAIVSATIKLGKKAAPVVINLPAAELKLVGNNEYFSADVKFLNAALDEYAKFSGFDEAMTRATFKEVWRRLSASNENGNTVTVNYKAGVAENVLYGDGANGAIRLYKDQVVKMVNNKPELVLEHSLTSTINEFWFGVPFTFNVKATLDKPAYLLDYSTADYVVDHNNAKTVFVDARIIDDVYTVSKSDLGKYFTVTNDVDNNNGIHVEFEIKTTGAPKTFNTTTGTPVENNKVDLVMDSTIGKYALVKNQAVIVDWTNDEKFFENYILLDAVLYANGIEIDRKPLVLYAKDPLAFTRADLGSEETPIRVPRYTYDNAYAYPVTALSLVSRVEGELIVEDATTMTGMFGNKDPKTTYGAEITTDIKRVYTKNADGTVTFYEAGKYDYTDGVLTLWGDEGILNASIFAEVEYVLSNHRFDEKTDAEHRISVHVEFYPATK